MFYVPKLGMTVRKDRQTGTVYDNTQCKMGGGIVIYAQQNVTRNRTLLPLYFHREENISIT